MAAGTLLGEAEEKKHWNSYPNVLGYILYTAACIYWNTGLGTVGQCTEGTKLNLQKPWDQVLPVRSQL